MTIVNDYTPSRVGYNPPSRSVLKTINQTQFGDKIVRNENKSRLASIQSRLNSSIDGSSINKIMSHEYDNMLGSRGYKVGMRKGSITKSQRDLINQSHDLSLDILQTRNAMNPITGDMNPSFSVKANKGSAFGMRY